MKHVRVLLDAWEETSVVEAIFGNAGQDEFPFIDLLKRAASGEQAAVPGLAQMAHRLARHLKIPRGPKVSAASASHQFILKTLTMLDKPGTYTWDENKGRCTDALTNATRLEFGIDHFDPRPAFRRQKRAKFGAAGAGAR